MFFSLSLSLLCTAPLFAATTPVAPAKAAAPNAQVWKSPSGSASCLPDEVVAGCRTVVRAGKRFCACPFPQH